MSEAVLKPKSHINQRRSTRYQKLYGLKFRQYRKLFLLQRRRCAICGILAVEAHLNNGSKLDFVVDHDHATGAVRGLLCSGCNTGLGFFKDNIDALKAAITYLENSPK